MIKLVRQFHGGLDQAKDGQVLEIAQSLPPGILEEYEKKGKDEKKDVISK